MKRSELSGRGLCLGALLAFPTLSAGQAFCPNHPGNPVLLTPGSATSCSYNSVTGDTMISLNGETLIEWDEFDVPAGSTTQFSFLAAANPSVVNLVTGRRTNNIDGVLTANGRLAIISPQSDTTVTGSISADSFLGVAIEPDNINEVLSGDPTSFGTMGGGSKRWFRVRGGAITTATGDLVLAGDNVIVSDATISASNGAVRLVGADQFLLNNTGVERVTEGGGPATGVQVTGVVQGGLVEVKSRGDITNDGTIEAGSGFGQIFLKVGPGGTVFNQGSGTLSGVVQITGNFDDIGILIGPNDQDAAVALASSTSDLPEIEDPRGRRTAAREQRQVAGAAGTVAVQRQEANARRGGTATAARKGLNRKSSFFGLVGRGTGKKE